MSYHTAERPLLIEMIRQEQHAYNKRAQKAGVGGKVPMANPGKTLFELHSANYWLEKEKDTAAPKPLFGEFWYEDELCILFADSNAGKSILAVQIGDSLSRREQIASLTIGIQPTNVLYMDFELSGKQFHSRYTRAADGLLYQFGRGFYRAGFRPNAIMPPNFATYEAYMNDAIEYAIKQTDARVLIIDNITCLRTGTERAADALPLMKHLKALKEKYNLSLLVLAHTPKRRPGLPITANDLQGSKMLINFADSAFAIGTNYNQPDQRYLKQIKQRSTEQIYGEDNIYLCHIEKQNGNFLKFEFTGHAAEHIQLRRHTLQEQQYQATRIAQLNQQGLSQRQISRELNLALSSVNKYLQRMHESKEADNGGPG